MACFGCDNKSGCKYRVFPTLYFAEGLVIRGVRNITEYVFLILCGGCKIKRNFAFKKHRGILL